VAKPFTAVSELLKYSFTGKGVFGTQVQQANIVLRSALLDENSRNVCSDPSKDLNGHDPANIPDVEIMLLPVSTADGPLPGIAKSDGTFTYLCTVLRPKSTGTVRLTSTDPRVQPLCDIGTFSERDDRIPLRKALRLALALARAVRSGGYTFEDALVPTSETDEALDQFANDNLMTTYHYSSSCRMDEESRMGVVDDELRVHGIAGLRIADASIFPQVPACHLQAPVVMVAERCAAFLTKG
jgi:choline dehydrogenase-like flavoprotein